MTAFVVEDPAGREKAHPLPVLRKRADFLAAARARRQGTAGFLLQARNRGDDGPARVGFTCSKNWAMPSPATAPSAGCARWQGWVCPDLRAPVGITS